MPIILESDLQESFQKAIQKANKTNSSILFSNVVKTQNVNPLSFYQVGRERYLGERLFWKDSNSDTVIVGLGKMEKVQTSADHNRFDNIEQRWNAIVEQSFVQANHRESGTGPIMFGGIS